jgi:dihydrodipicolinate synthase/N-acetylneuraminate lyase
VIKAALHALDRIPAADVRMPLSPASREGTARALELLRHLEP